MSAEYNCPPICPKCHRCHRGPCQPAVSHGWAHFYFMTNDSFARELERENHALREAGGLMRASLPDTQTMSGPSVGIGSSALLGFFVRDCVNVAVTKIVDDVSWNRFDLQQAWDLMSVEERMRFAKNTRDAIDASVKKAVEEVENSVRAQLGGAPTSVLWGPAGLLAATMRCVLALQDSEMPND